MARAKKAATVTWCKPTICAQRYDVEISTEEETEHLEGREAATVWEDTKIFIREDLSDERKEDCLAHEIFVHAILEAYGIDHILRDKLGITEKQWRVFEEDLAKVYAPALLATLKNNGWLKLPKIPKKRASAKKPSAGKPKRA